MRIISACPVKSLVGCLLFFSLTILAKTAVLAHSDSVFPQVSEGQINEAFQKTVPLRFLPSHPLYFLISAKERVNHFFKASSAKKAQFDFVLAGKRLKEAFLLLQEGKVETASENFRRYSWQLDKMVKRLEKARSQNQEVGVLVSEIAEGLKIHEILFYAIGEELEKITRDHTVDENFEMMTESFRKTILAIDNVQPGLKDRFKITTSFEKTTEENLSAPPTAPSLGILEATPTVKPRRIIY